MWPWKTWRKLSVERKCHRVNVMLTTACTALIGLVTVSIFASPCHTPPTLATRLSDAGQKIGSIALLFTSTQMVPNRIETKASITSRWMRLIIMSVGNSLPHTY